MLTWPWSFCIRNYHHPSSGNLEIYIFIPPTVDLVSKSNINAKDVEKIESFGPSKQATDPLLNEDINCKVFLFLSHKTQAKPSHSFFSLFFLQDIESLDRPWVRRQLTMRRKKFWRKQWQKTFMDEREREIDLGRQHCLLNIWHPLRAQ